MGLSSNTASEEPPDEITCFQASPDSSPAETQDNSQTVNGRFDELEIPYIDEDDGDA